MSPRSLLHYPCIQSACDLRAREKGELFEHEFERDLFETPHTGERGWYNRPANAGRLEM